MALRETEPMPEAEARLLSPLRLAYMGDTVWELLIRQRLLASGKSVRHMHQGAVSGVNAGAQAIALHRIAGALTEAEIDVVHRGRNAHARHPAPRHQQQADYQAATGLEALMGYLYVTGQEERLKQLFALTQAEEDAACRK